MNPVSQIIRTKREWHTPPPSAEDQGRGFSGWRSRWYLPHFDVPGVIQGITYRLADAMPASLRHEWAALLKIEDDLKKRTAIENYLDRGCGKCHLRNSQIAAIIQENLLHFDEDRYRLIAWSIMPNHVHVLIEVWQTPLKKITHTWKSYTSKEANKILGRRGIFWQEEYFDRYIRDEEHFQKAVRYIENNPVKAKLVRQPEEWIWGSAGYRHRGAVGSTASR